VSCNVLILGCGSYLGSSYASYLLSKGHSVGGTFSSKESAKKSGLSNHTNFSDFVVDIEDVDDFSAAIDGICSVLLVEKVVSFWGFHSINPFRTTRINELSKSFLYNVSANIEFVRLLLRKCKSVNSVVFTSSVAGVKPEKGLLSYTIAKSALISATQVLALELARSKIRVNCISPGWIDSPSALKSSKKLNVDIEVLNKVYPLGTGVFEYLISSYDLLLFSKEGWITGQNIVVDGGWTLT
jgi:NAD(P)-dependent dehydrogenase (short-subunit alcohol dehydrogenase family)